MCKPLFADEFRITPFVRYEEAIQNIVIDSVSMKYSLGVAGVELRTNYGDSFTISNKLGYGQKHDQKTSFAGANFSGKVTGSYLILAGNMNFKGKITSYSLVQYSTQKEISTHQTS